MTTLTPQQLSVFKGEACRRDLKRFIKEFWHVVEPTQPFQDGYHIDAICDHLANLKDIRNLVINIPPRMGKSTLICVLWFCWYWISNPSARFIYASYSLQLSTRDSIRCRAMIESELYQAYYGHLFTLRPDQNTKTRFENDKTGARLAVSVDGCIGAETKLYDPIANVSRRVDAIGEDFHVYSLDVNTGKVVVAKATKPFVKGETDLYRFFLSNGQTFVATLDHRVCVYADTSLYPYTGLSNTSHDCGSKTESHCRIADRLPGTSLHPSPRHVPCFAWLTLRELAARLPQTASGNREVSHGEPEKGATPDSQACCHSQPHSCGGQPRWVASSVLNAPPLSSGVLEHKPHWHTDGEDSRLQHNLCDSSCHPSSLDCLPPNSCAAYLLSYEFVRRDVFYDLTIPRYENYIHAGVVHHNSTVGEGGDIIVADDPHNIQEAESRANRDSVIRWFTTVFSNRLNNPMTGCRVLVMQRCHAEDICGHILKNDIEQNWTKLILPLEAGRAKCLSTRWTDTRAEGELLSPDRLPQSEVNFLQRQLGHRAFQSQYNQNPAPPEDQLLKTDNIEFYDTLPEGGMRIAAVDLAISLKGDYTVIAVADIHRDGSIYLVHLHRERMLGPKIIPTVRAIHDTYQPQIVYIEDASFQRFLIDEARRQKLPVRGIKPEDNKIARSTMLQIRIDNHQFFLPFGKNNKDIIDELTDFPNSSHDDIVDALSYVAIAGNQLYRHIPEPERQLTPEEKLEKQIKEHEERMRAALWEGID